MDFGPELDRAFSYLALLALVADIFVNCDQTRKFAAKADRVRLLLQLVLVAGLILEREG